MSSPESFSLAELADQAKLPARTIRFYIARGLLEGPERAGRGATYSQRHLERLAQIKKLQESGLMLAEIARLLGGEPEPRISPAASPWWQYEVAPDVIVYVKGELSPWRSHQVRTALRELARRLENDKDEREE